MKSESQEVVAGIPNLKPHPPLQSFASPDLLDPDLQFFLERACLLLCDWLAKSSKGTPLPQLDQMPDIAPNRTGIKSEILFRDLQIIVDGAYKPSHPGSLAHLDPPPITASIVADLISAGLNNNLLADELSPSLSNLERKLCKWFSEKIGMNSSGGGVIASGGSLSNLNALVVARKNSGLEYDPSAVIIASADSHVSLIKARKVMGLKEDALQIIPTNNDGQISLLLLEEKLKSLKSQGKRCFAIVATAGTTIRGAVDPIKDLANICLKEGLWLHVDAAIGGVFALNPLTASLVEGISLADSVTLNPQKLLGIAKTSSLLIVAKKTLLSSTFSTGLPYIEAPSDEPYGGEMGIQGTRSAEALKLWLGLRQLGEEGISNLLNQALHRKIYFEKQIDNSLFSIKSGPLHIIAITPKGLDKPESEIWSSKTKKLLLENQYMVSRPIYNDLFYIKIVFGNPYTQENHLDSLAKIINLSVK